MSAALWIQLEPTVAAQHGVKKEMPTIASVRVPIFLIAPSSPERKGGLVCEMVAGPAALLSFLSQVLTYHCLG